MTDPHPQSPPPAPVTGPPKTWPDLFAGAQVDYGDIPVPTNWAQIPAGDAAQQWQELRAWVDDLQARFAHLDHHAIPRCWWRHNGHVEALVALRDHQRSSYADTAPATAPVDWFRALRDITALLRAWTAELGCGATHQAPTTPLRPFDAGEWERFVADDTARRRAAEPAGPAAADSSD